MTTHHDPTDLLDPYRRPTPPSYTIVSARLMPISGLICLTDDQSIERRFTRAACRHAGLPDLDELTVEPVTYSPPLIAWTGGGGYLLQVIEAATPTVDEDVPHAG